MFSVQVTKKQLYIARQLTWCIVSISAIASWIPLNKTMLLEIMIPFSESALSTHLLGSTVANQMQKSTVLLDIFVLL